MQHINHAATTQYGYAFHVRVPQSERACSSALAGNCSALPSDFLLMLVRVCFDFKLVHLLLV